MKLRFSLISGILRRCGLRLVDVLLFAVAFISLTTSAAALPDHENSRVLNRGTEKPHATMTVCPDAASADAARHHEDSPFHCSLNGEWNDFWLPKPVDVPGGFWKPDFSTASWTKIPVPANVELHGHDIPILENIIYPFLKAGQKPTIEMSGKVPAGNNPVSLYRRTFTVPVVSTNRSAFNRLVSPVRREAETALPPCALEVAVD